MEAVNGYYNGHAFVPAKPIKTKMNRRAVLTILDDPVEDTRVVQKQSWLNFFAAIDAASDEELIGDPEPVRIDRTLDL